MSPLGIAGKAFSLFSALNEAAPSPSGTTATHGDFASSLALRLATQRTQSVDALLGTLSGTTGSTGLAGLFGGSSTLAGSNGLFAALGLDGGGGSSVESVLGGLSPLGRNLSLFDPESAFSMMSGINTRDVDYKAQFAELSEMKTAVGEMREAGETLAAAAGDAATMGGALHTFVDRYNAWVDRFEGTVQAGGVLAGTQAAEISLYELRQSVENVFTGAGNGFRGMADLGLSIDPATHRASLDDAKLQSALAGKRDGAIATVGEFGRHFARSAELLVSENNFIPNRLGNLDRVIDYLDEHLPSLQAEFGLGASARPSPATAKALAAYERMLQG